MVISSRAMNHLARNPRALIEFQMTGKVPRGRRPDSPLIRLLETLTPRARMSIEGVSIYRLGYNTHYVFRNAEQLYRWVKPSEDVFGSYPAETAKNHRFSGTISLDELLKSSKRHPEWVVKERVP
mgnify:CR=1 FL=1